MGVTEDMLFSTAKAQGVSQIALIRTMAEQCDIYLVPPSVTVDDGSCDEVSETYNQIKRRFAVSDAQVLEHIRASEADADVFIFLFRVCGIKLEP